MHADRFDTLTRALTGAMSRRRLLCGLASASLGVGLARLPDGASAGKRRRKPRFNAFGCLDVGTSCGGKDNRCCSGICEGPKPRRGKKDASRCVAHDAATCRAGQLNCEGVSVPCTTSAGQGGGCYTTTGNAGYCANDGDCFACSKDADCRPYCGPRAACIRCETGCAGIGTLCLGPDTCTFP